MIEGEYFSAEDTGSGAGSRGRRSDSASPDDTDRIEQERRFLQRLGFSKPFLKIVAERARRHGTTVEAELLADGRVREDAYYGALAVELDLPFLAVIDPTTLIDRQGIDTQLRQPRLLRCYLAQHAPTLAIVPSALELLEADTVMRRSAGLRARLAVTTPGAIRQAVWRAGEARRLDEAANRLFDTEPDLSARIVFTGIQGFVAGLSLAALALLFVMAPQIALLVTHIVLTSAFFLSLVFRFLAIQAGPRLTETRPLEPAGELPIYTVLVPLYAERAVLAQLINRLNRLEWPRSKLDIKLLCEARDPDTVSMLRAMRLGQEYETVIVPDGLPRTKPKALNYGLSAARGDYLVIYDAEDRPHADQLLEAWQHFRRAGPKIACLQAPLHVGNLRDGWIAALFALEYSGLFRRVLPLLAALGLPMPLGGTSNHFRIDLLRSAGGWDAFNVTEDADLGYRLYRLGYRSEMLGRPTVEDAPTEIGVWFGQRGRWFKGWMQTWLVLMRSPRRLTAELGLGGTICFHALITGMLVSALAHPLIIVFIGVAAWHFTQAVYTTPLEQALFLIDGLNVFGAYTLFVLLGRQAMTSGERRRLGLKWLYVPIYWLMISYAAWRAVIELNTRPFHWQKTPHRPVSQR